MNISYSPKAFPSEFGRIVAEASMHLPPLTRPQDTAFLRRVTEAVVDLFWSNYIALLPQNAQASYEKAEEEGTGKALYEWHMQHANFPADENAEKRGARVLAEIAAKLPDAMKLEYANFTELDAHTA